VLCQPADEVCFALTFIQRPPPQPVYLALCTLRI
jgi:hypothetical protein